MQTSQTTRRLRAAALGALLWPAALRAQSVLGGGEDATVLRPGVLRFGVLNRWERFFERYRHDLPGRRDGTLAPLGADFSIDTVGARTFEQLGPLETSIRALSGLPDFNASLGTTVAHVRSSVLTTPLSLEIGLARRLSIGAMVPFVTARTDVDLRVNPSGRQPTLGFNPTLSVPAAIAANAALLTQFDSAASQLTQRLAFCGANPGATGCAAVNANANAARTLIAESGAFASRLAQVYGGRSGAAGSPFVPVAGTSAQAAIEARVAAYTAMYASFGTAAITGTGPLPAQAPFTAADFQRLLTDSAFGVRARPLATSVVRGTGDIDLSLKLNLFGPLPADAQAGAPPAGFHWRQSVGAVYRLGGGALDAPDDFTDLGAGDHQNDVEARSFTDLLFGRRLWVSLVARYTVQLADERVARITESPGKPLAAAYREHTVRRDLGDVFDLEVNPRWALNDYAAVAFHYYYRRKFSDAYTGSFNVTNLAGQAVTLDASALDAGTEAREHRFGGGVTYSTVAAFAQGKARLPLDITYFHTQTTRGAHGAVPKLGVDQVAVRVYARIFGR